MNKWIIVLSFFALGFLFFFIWQKMITSYYRKRLRSLELESLRQELAEKDERIRKLEENNDELARIIHRDNKLIPAMETSVYDFLKCASDTPEDIAVRGAALAEQLEEMAKGRSGILSNYESRRQTVAKTGHVGLDGVLTYMHDRALKEKIRFEVKVGEGFAEVIPDRLSEADCSHLLSDLIENALIAVTHSENREILVHLGVLYDYPVIEISDSGIAFEPAVYQDFGLEKHSTHLDENGSGIGLLDIWKLKKQYKASLHIHEYLPQSGIFTKKIALVFDRKGHYLIRSYRNSELSLQKVRSDLYILPLD